MASDDLVSVAGMELKFLGENVQYQYYQIY